MSWGLSTYLFRQQSLGARQLEEIASVGFTSIEIYGDRGHFDYTNTSQLREIAQWAGSAETRISALHAPVSREPHGSSPHSLVSISFLDRQRRQDSMDEIKRALETAEYMPIPHLIVHLGVDGEEFDLRKFDAAMTSLEHLCLFAKQRGVQVLIENSASDLSSPQRLKQFFTHTHLRGVDVCLDTGHAQLEGGVMAAVETLGKAISVVHLSDNNGALDDHLLPLNGAVPWQDFLGALAGAAPGAVRTIEARAQEGGKPPLEQARASREQLQELIAAASH